MARLPYIYALLILFVTFPDLCVSQSVVFMPSWTAQSEFAGYYAAEKLGFYKEEGVDVQIKHPTVSESSLSLLEKGEAQIVVTNLSNALTAVADGMRIVNVMQTSQTNSLLLVSRFPMSDMASLNHRRIAVWNRLPQDLIDRLAQVSGLEVEWIRFNRGVDIFLSGAVDIFMAYSFNEYPQLAECGMKPDSCYVFRLAEHGYNLPEDGIYVTEDYYNTHKDLVDKFVRASISGWNWVERNRERALDFVMEVVREKHVATNRYHQSEMLREILRLQYDLKTGKKTYKLNEEGFNIGVQYLISNDRIPVRYQDFVK